MIPKLNILLQIWEKLRFHHYKGEIATQIEHFAKKLREFEISILQWFKCYPNWSFYYKTERTSDFITKKVILQLKLNISLQNWENKRLSTKGILQLKLNILLQNLEIFRSLLLPRWYCNSNWTLCYKIERN